MSDTSSISDLSDVEYDYIEQVYAELKDGKPVENFLDDNVRNNRSIPYIGTTAEYELGPNASKEDSDIVNERGCVGVYDTSLYNSYRYLDTHIDAIANVEINGSPSPKCKATNSVISEQIQIRSGDEGSSVIERCYAPNCGYIKVHK